MTPQSGTKVTYAIDPRASQFTVQAFASGLISAVAHSPKIAIRDWAAETTFAPDSLSNAHLRVAIKAASLEVLDELRDSDRRELHRVMNQQVLETEKFPEIVFESTNVNVENLRESLYRADIEGNLALHGVTNTHNFSSQVAFGMDTFRAYAEFKVLQTDYRITIASIAGGTLKLQDELKVSFYVVGRKQAS